MCVAGRNRTGVAGQCPRGGGGTEKQTSSMVVPTGRGMTSSVRGGCSGAPPRGGEGCRTLARVDPPRGGKGYRIPGSEQPSERAVVERAIDALPDVPGLVRRQDTASMETQGSAGRFHYYATASIGQGGVEARGSMCCRAGAGVGSKRVASVYLCCRADTSSRGKFWRWTG